MHRSVMHRRDFLSASATALAAGAVLGPLAACAGAGRGTAPRRSESASGVPAALGVQLWTVRDRLPTDFAGTLATIAADGYAEVEFAGYHDHTPQQVRSVLDDVGLAAPSAHVPLDRLRTELDTVIAEALVVGHTTLVVPWLAPEQRPDRDGYRALADEINAMGQRTAPAGIRMAYHNHDFEFETGTGETGGELPFYDSLVERLDPAVADLELDLYWVTKAGFDPADYFARYPGRFPLWHVKDGRGADLEMVDVGDGRIDFARLFALAGTAGLRHAYVEHDLFAQDATIDSLRTVHRSLEALERLRGA